MDNKLVKNFKRYKSGFTLVEVLVAVVLTGLAFTIFLQALNTGKMVRVKSELRTKQSVILNSIENQIRARKFDENDSFPWSDINDFGKDELELIISQFDDVDDFHQYNVSSINEFPGFGYTVKVFYSLPPPHSAPNQNKQTFLLTDSQTNYKSVAISVIHETLTPLNDTLVITPKW